MLFPLWTGSRTRECRATRARNRRPRAARRPIFESLDERCLLSADVVIQWNQAVLAAIRNDKPTIGFLTRDLAIVQSAIYDAVNAVDHTSNAFLVQADAPADASPVAAAAAAGLFTASALFPTDTALFQATYQASLAGVPDGQAKTDGIAVGRFVAEQTLIARATDGANAVVNYTPGTNPGDWRPTPSAFAPAQTPQWPDVTPFALNQRLPVPPGPAPGVDQRGLHGRLRRGQGLRERGQHRPHGPADGCGSVLGGQGRHPPDRRLLEPDRGECGPVPGQHAGPGRPAVRRAERRAGRRHDRLLRCQVHIQPVAPGHGHPARRPGRQSRHRRRSELAAAEQHGEPPVVGLRARRHQRRGRGDARRLLRHRQHQLQPDIRGCEGRDALVHQLLGRGGRGGE